MRLSLSSLIHATLIVLFATILLLFLPALRSYFSTEGPIDEAREDITQIVAFQRFAYLLERSSFETLDVALAGESLDRLRATNEALARNLATLRDIAEAEEQREADEMVTIERVEALDQRLRRASDEILELSRQQDRAAVIEAAGAAWEQQRGASSFLAEALLRETDAVNESLDALLAASGHFAFVPFVPIEEKTHALRVTATATHEATRFLLFFERLAGEIAHFTFQEVPSARVDLAAGLADRALLDWRLYAVNHAEAPSVLFERVEEAYRRFREVGEKILAELDREQRLATFREELEPLAETGVRDLMDAAGVVYGDTLQNSLDEIEDQFEMAGIVILLLIVALTAVMLISPWLLSRWIVRPISELSGAARALGQGDLTQRVKIRGSREIRELTKSFNRTAEDLGELQERLKRQERLAVLGELAGSIGHEIRNPLGAMKGSIFYLQRRREKTIDAKAEEHLDRIDRLIRRANRIVTELLDYARNPVTSPRSIDLDDVLDEAISAVEIPPEVRLERLEKNGGLPVRADPEQVRRILENLISNAVQAMPDGGELRLGCDARGGEAVASVADTGVGIAAEDSRKIFEPLVTSKAKGIGLGLPVAQRYAELNGGRIECESEPGRGSLFRLILPVAAAANEASYDS